MMRNLFLFSLLSLSQLSLFAQSVQQDEASDLMELQVIASPREEGAMRRQPASVTLVDEQQMQAVQAGSLKQLGSLVPNFYMPEYGSRMSSAVYIRGIGSRINSPAIGLYVDDVPVLDKSSFDFGLYGMHRVDVLRGPQTTLYGTGTMGGVMKVYSLSPFDYQGTEIGLGYATRDNTRKITLMHYSKPLDRFAWSFGGYYQGGDGYFKNNFKGLKQDNYDEGGIRFRAMLLTRRQWSLDMALNYEMNNEGAYPYYYVGRRDGHAEDRSEQLHRINSNLKGLYERSVFRTSLNASKVFPKLELRSITSLQTLSDSMQMDQDLLSDDIYQLKQLQKNLAVTEDVLLKSRKPGRWQWITGATASMMRSRIKGPVTFREEGVEMLNGIINQQGNDHLPLVQAGPMTMRFAFDDRIQGKELLFDNKFTTYAVSAGAFHQSSFHDLFGIEGLSATLGLRFNADVRRLNYGAWYDFDHVYGLNGHLKTPGMEKDIVMVAPAAHHVWNGLYSSDYAESQKGIKAQSPVRDVNFELMPRFALQYEFDGLGNLYATVSRGYRSGGYNVQNISEIMRSLMMRDMMAGVRDATLPVLAAQPMVPQDTKDMVTGILNGMAETAVPDVAESCTYDPEYVWNYELGAHLNLFQGRLSLDASAFLSDISNLQLSQMSQSGLGRIMVNAGKSRSAGMELMLKSRPVENLLLQANYGYTHATFREYTDYDSDAKNIVECDGNYVPFMPQHTVGADVSYTIPLNANRPAYTFNRNNFIPKGITFGVNYSGAGRVYWTERNDEWQDFYSMLGARATLDIHPLQITLWGKNLTNSHHNTFWFVSAGRAFEQHVRPLQVGIDAKFLF